MSYLGGTDSRHRFFGDNARAIAQVETRRNPLAFSMYAVVMALGLIFVFHLFAQNRTEHDLFPHVSPWAIFAWKWMMSVGGLASTVTLLFNPRPSPHWPDIVDLLHLEAIFAGISSVGLAIYLIVVVHLTGFEASYQAIAFFGFIILGHVWRTKDCVVDARKLVKLNESLKAEQAAHDAPAS